MFFYVGSKNDGYDEGNNAISEDARISTRPQYEHREPDERLRLLPSRPRLPNPDSYLDPDDPAVSPYNLWFVCFLCYVTVLFLIISCLWWVLLLVSLFVSSPGMHSCRSGVFDFSYTCLTIGNLMVAVLFFASPAKAMRVTSAVITVFFVIDMISGASNPFEEGWVRIASAVWATIIALWCTLTDRIVAWGKREEEERFTGCPETRRTLKEWLAVLVPTMIPIVFIIIVILMTGTLGIRARDASLKTYGERIFVD